MDWMPYAALAVSILALIPSFATLMYERRDRKQPGAEPPKQVPPTPSPAPPPAATTAPAADAAPKKPLNDFGKSLVLIVYGVGILIWELIGFNLLAHLFGVDVSDVKKMPASWLIGFYCLFILPGAILLRAQIYFFGLWERGSRKQDGD